MFDQVIKSDPSADGEGRGQSKTGNPPASLPVQNTPQPESLAKATPPATNNPSVSSASTPQVEDMFSKIDHSSPQVATPMNPGGDVGRAPAPEDDLFSKKTGKSGNILTIVLVVVLIAIVAVVGWFGWNYYQSKNGGGDGSVIGDNNNGVIDSNTSNNSNDNQPAPNENNNPNKDNNTDNNTDGSAVIPEPPLDTDSDGLSDKRERELGTDPENVDSDNDGLIDKSEVDIYHTDPNNPDTDGDGYKDGAEVINGFNPAGPGKLF